MTALAAALALAAAAALPGGAARYRVEIAGLPVGVAELSLACADDGDSDRGCALRWESRLRLPAAAGGGLRHRRIAARLEASGALLGEAEVEVDGARRRRAGAGRVPLAAAELVLAARGGCAEVIDEETGRTGPACARGEGGRLQVEALGVLEEVEVGPDGFPDLVELPAQATRFVRDPAAQVPATAPPLEVRVPGPPAGRIAARFCGLAPDPPPPAAGLPALPAPAPDGRSCREQAADYAAALRRAGVPARIALGVAHDGRGFAWHAWVEARTAAGWVAVDPALGQLPAAGPRFTVARHGGDPAGAAEAGRRILACWGRAAVE